MKKFLAWCVHFYTALGLVAAGGIAVAILDGTPTSFRMAFLLMLVATIIDATDGTLARLVKVKEVLPKFDGRRLDDLIDFQTYTSLPLLLIWRAGLVPEGEDFWLLFPLLASAYGFCQVSAKTEDGYFLGFPSYWNIVAFYLYVLNPPPIVSVAMLVTFSHSDLRACPLSLSDASRPAQSLGQCAGRPLVRCAGRHHGLSSRERGPS